MPLGAKVVFEITQENGDGSSITVKLIRTAFQACPTGASSLSHLSCYSRTELNLLIISLHSRLISVGLIDGLEGGHTCDDATGAAPWPYLRGTFAGLLCTVVQAILSEPIANKSRGTLFGSGRFTAVVSTVYIICIGSLPASA